VTWLPFLVITTGPTTSVTPVDQLTSSVVSYSLPYSVLGAVSLALAFRFLVPKGTVTQAGEEARADLLKENERLIAEKKQAEERTCAPSSTSSPL
jgi:hypothetical protein